MKEIHQVAVSDIQINQRVRRDLGNIAELKESIRKFGLINPIIVDQHFNLIAGHRRLEAVRALGFDYIEVRILHSSKRNLLLKIELEENLHRKDFTERELQEGKDTLKKLEHPSIFIRIFRLIKRLLGITG